MTGRGAAKRGQVVDNDEGVPGAYDPDIDAGYNPADFIIPGSDHQGHAERVFCRVQPQIARAMNVIFKSGKFPFRTEGDLFRWCLVRGLKVLDRLDPTPGFMGAADAINEILRQEMYLQEFTSMFSTMEKVVHAHVANGATREARKLISTVLAKVRTIDEGHWRKKCEQDIVRRFGHLLEGAEGVRVRANLNAGGGENDHE